MNINKLLSYLENSYTPFHAVDNIKKLLLDSSFIEISEKEHFKLVKGKSYFLTRGGSALIAFKVPKTFSSFHISASHTDSPCFKIKHSPVIKGLYSTLNAELYGSAILSSWLDRPLSVAGRLFLKENRSVLVNLERPLIIPNLAIHMDRETNSGKKFSVQKDMRALLGDSESDLLEELAEKERFETDDILDYDLFLYCAEKPLLWGDYFSSPRIDNLTSVFTSVSSLISSKPKNVFPIAVLFNNEETGSGSYNGALSDFLENTLERISLSLKLDKEDYFIKKASSLIISSDNGHAVHPNHSEKADITNKPVLNKGVLIKYTASQKYTTNAESGAFLISLMKKNNIPYQSFFNNSDIAGGSTLGSLLVQKVSINAADVGIAELAMHSAFETAGVKDIEYISSLFDSFYSL